MEEIIAQCSHCGQRVRAPVVALGKRGRCPGCGKGFVVKPAQSAHNRPSAATAGGENALVEETDLWGSDPGFDDGAAREESAVSSLAASFCSPGAGASSVSAPFSQEPTSTERFLRLNADNPSQVCRNETGEAVVCPRCTKAYRGLWDQVHTSEGVMCHRCANLVVGDTPSLITRDQAAKAREHPAGPPQPQEAPPIPFTERFRGQLIYGGVCLFIMLLILLLPVERWIGAAMYGQVAAASDTMHPEWNRFFAILKLVLGLAGYYIALHATLKASKRIEDWEWTETVPYVLKGAVIIYLWMIVCLMVSWYPVVGILLFGMGVVLLPIILWFVYGFSVSEFLILTFFLSLTHPLLWAVGHVLYGVLAFAIT